MGDLGEVITNKAGILSYNVKGELGSCFTLMEHTVSNCEAALRDEMQTTVEMTVLKMPVGDESHRYQTDGTTKPKSHI